MAITYRFLTQDQFSLLEPSIKANGGDLPDPNLSVVAGAFNDQDRLVGYAVLSLVPHLEPVNIDEDYRAKVNWRSFQDMIEGLFDKEHGGSYFALASNPKAEKACRRAGMILVDMPLYRRDL